MDYINVIVDIQGYSKEFIKVIEDERKFLKSDF